jgi:hypothetical protein
MGKQADEGEEGDMQTPATEIDQMIVWTTFTPPQNPAHAAFCGLVLHGAHTAKMKHNAAVISDRA